MLNQLLAEKAQIAQAFLPVAMNAGAVSADWVSLKLYGRCSVVFFKAVGTAGDDPTITLLQATDVTGAGSKALTINRVDKKQAATNLLAVGQFTTSTPAAPALHDTFNANTWTNSDLAEQAAIVVIEVKAEDLDVTNGFDCISFTIADVGTNAQLGCGLFVLHEPRYQDAQLASAIVD
jgi:hypothetical protein